MNKFQLKKYKRVRGFTLVEVILTVSILALVSTAIYHTLANGIKLWERSRQAIHEEDISITFDKMQTDLHNAFFYSLIKLEGKKDRLKFSTQVLTKADSKSSFEDEYIDQIGQVEYYFNAAKGQVLRRQRNYSQALKDKGGNEQILLNSIKSLRFRYHYKENNEDVEVSEISKQLPCEVDIFIDFNDQLGIKQLTKTIEFPLGN